MTVDQKEMEEICRVAGLVWLPRGNSGCVVNPRIVSVIIPSNHVHSTRIYFGGEKDDYLGIDMDIKDVLLAFARQKVQTPIYVPNGGGK